MVIHFYSSSSQNETNLLSVDQNETISEDSIYHQQQHQHQQQQQHHQQQHQHHQQQQLSSTTTTTVPITVENISDAQNQLTILGLYSGDINNELNNETKAALKEFQRLAGLSVDGILGPKTKAALEKGEDSYIGIGGADVNNVEVIIYSKEIENAQKT